MNYPIPFSYLSDLSNFLSYFFLINNPPELMNKGENFFLDTFACLPNQSVTKISTVPERNAIAAASLLVTCTFLNLN